MEEVIHQFFLYSVFFGPFINWIMSCKQPEQMAGSSLTYYSINESGMKGALYYCIPNLSSTHQNTTGNFPKIKNLIYLACDFHFRTDRPTERQTDIQLVCLRVEKNGLR